MTVPAGVVPSFQVQVQVCVSCMPGSVKLAEVLAVVPRGRGAAGTVMPGVGAHVLHWSRENRSADTEVLVRDTDYDGQQVRRGVGRVVIQVGVRDHGRPAAIAYCVRRPVAPLDRDSLCVGLPRIVDRE